MKNKILWITRTAVMMALLVTLQWATSGLSQFVTGSCVNAVLAVATLTAGLWSGVAVALLSPFCAFLLGIGPKLIQMVPAIALGMDTNNKKTIMSQKPVKRNQSLFPIPRYARATFGRKKIWFHKNYITNA